MPDIQQAYDQLVKRYREIWILQSCRSVLGWDERVNMPPNGAKNRSEQISLLSRLIHEQQTAPDIKTLLEQVSDSDLTRDETSITAVNIREFNRSYAMLTKIPAAWMATFSRTTALAQHAWVDARKNNDFATFLPHLKTIIALRREYAEMIGYEKDPYDALIDFFEPEATYESISTVFAGFRDGLVDLIGRIQKSPATPDNDLITGDFPEEIQARFGREASAAIGFDYQSGRLDPTVHPFCSGFGPGDTRLTTRYERHYFPMAFFGILHESGHGIYNQGLDPEHYGAPMGNSVSLSIHESQSRMWENIVGRNRRAWDYFFPRAKAHFPDKLGKSNADDFYAAINQVKPSFIRVEADEVTYNLHIIIRFELEHAIINDDIKPEDIPAAWNEKYAAYLGVTPATDSEGCLQDIHWSSGMFGYFPTYALGNLYAAQFYARAKEEMPDLENDFSRGEFTRLRQWLTDKIYRQGMRYRSGKLLEHVTGRPLSPQYHLDYLTEKFGKLYGL